VRAIRRNGDSERFVAPKPIRSAAIVAHVNSDEAQSIRIANAKRDWRVSCLAEIIVHRKNLIAFRPAVESSIPTSSREM
jgi:hypothetical protein